MNAEELRSVQAPLKERYRTTPDADGGNLAPIYLTPRANSSEVYGAEIRTAQDCEVRRVLQGDCGKVEQPARGVDPGCGRGASLDAQRSGVVCHPSESIPTFRVARRPSRFGATAASTSPMAYHWRQGFEPLAIKIQRK